MQADIIKTIKDLIKSEHTTEFQKIQLRELLDEIQKPKKESKVSQYNIIEIVQMILKIVGLFKDHFDPD